MSTRTVFVMNRGSGHLCTANCGCQGKPAPAPARNDRTGYGDSNAAATYLRGVAVSLGEEQRKSFLRLVPGLMTPTANNKQPTRKPTVQSVIDGIKRLSRRIEEMQRESLVSSVRTEVEQHPGVVASVNTEQGTFRTVLLPQPYFERK